MSVKCFYVYVHRRATDGVVFYVGKGKGQRIFDKRSRNLHWKNVAEKHGFTAHKVMDNLSEPCAYSLEKALIATRQNLANYATGGEVNSGFKWSLEQRKAISESRKGRKPPPITYDGRRRISESLKQRKPSPETLAKMSGSRKGKKQSKSHAEKSRTAKLGKKMTAEFGQLVRERISKRVICETDGATFRSMTEAATFYGVSVASISMVCSGKLKSVASKKFRKIAA